MTLFFEQLKQSTAAAQQAMLTAPVIADVQQGTHFQRYVYRLSNPSLPSR